MQPPARRLAAIVYNPTKIDAASLRESVATAERAAGWEETLWFETTEEDAGQGGAEKALAAGVGVIIAAGGDGTVRAVAEGMHDSDAALALLPSGTGNLLARNLKLTLDDLDNALRTAFSGVDRRIDLGAIDIRRQDDSVTSHVYVVMAGLGIDAEMLANTDADLKKRIGWLAYAKALAKTLLENNSLNFRYSFDGGPPRSMKANTMIIGNCGALPANILLLPDAAVDDGLFDVLLLRPESILGWFKIIYKVFWENGVIRRLPFADRLKGKEDQAMRYVKVKTVTAKLRDPEDIEIDGDAFGKAIGFRASVEPGGLKVRVPAE